MYSLQLYNGWETKENEIKLRDFRFGKSDSRKILTAPSVLCFPPRVVYFRRCIPLSMKCYALIFIAIFLFLYFYLGIIVIIFNLLFHTHCDAPCWVKARFFGIEIENPTLYILCSRYLFLKHSRNWTQTSYFGVLASCNSLMLCRYFYNTIST